MSTDAALDRIAEKLRLARARGLRSFGTDGRELMSAPPLAPGELAAAETRLGVELPEEYRAFVTRVGDGGAGPGYGLFSLETALREAGIDTDSDLLRAPFPHLESWNPDSDPEVVAFWDRIDAEGGSREEKALHVLRERSGALPLCDEGCGYLHFLVVTGPARGTMWIDSRGGDAGFGPLNATFLEWYERWLDDLLAGGHGTWWLGPAVYPTG